MKNLHLQVAVFVCTVFTSTTSGAQVKYQKEFDETYNLYRNEYDSVAMSGRGSYYYAFQGVLMGTLSVFEATGDLKYLERVLRWAETMVAKATITKGPYKSWSGRWDAMPTNGVPTSSNLDFLQGATELARLVRIIRTDASLNARFSARVDRIFDFIHRNIVLREYTHAKDWHLNTTYTNDLGRRVAYQNDKTALFARILIEMHRAGANVLEPNVTYHDYAVKLLNRYLTFVTTTSAFSAKGAELWHYRIFEREDWCGAVVPCSEDTSHGNRWPALIFTAISATTTLRGVNKSPTGSTLTQHFSRLGRLFSQVIWNQSLTTPKFSNYIDGSNENFRTNTAWMNGSIGSWAFVGAADGTALKATEAMIDAIVAGQTPTQNPSVQYNRFASRSGLIGNTILARALAGKLTQPPNNVVPSTPSQFVVQ